MSYLQKTFDFLDMIAANSEQHNNTEKIWELLRLIGYVLPDSNGRLIYANALQELHEKQKMNPKRRCDAVQIIFYLKQAMYKEYYPNTKLSWKNYTRRISYLFKHSR